MTLISGTHHSAEVQSVYSTFPADWAQLNEMKNKLQEIEEELEAAIP